MKLVLLTVLLTLSPAVSAISCKNQYDYDVQWFAAMKMPDDVNGDTVGSKAGTGFYYLDVTARSSFVPSAVSIDQPHQAIGYTLQQYYDNPTDKNTLYVFYNDEPADGSTSFSMIYGSQDDTVQFGHTKGVLLFNDKDATGIWLIHSVPKFPVVGSKYVYPSSGTDYGQSFLCLTLDKSTLAQLGTVLYYNHPDVYSYNMPSWATNISPDLTKVLKGQYNNDPKDTTYIQPITVSGAKGPAMKVFAKTYLYNNDLYAGMVAPAYKAALEAETWRRGDLIDTVCKSSYPVYDAQDIKIGATDEYKYTKDHSKYARTLDSSIPAVCIGDINRMTSQYVRGGGTVCILDSTLWKTYDVFRDLPSC